ncbi:MAG: HypC/HybG/HupF family hydrogenase formation chaperone, partial [Promethearchaeati archaeon]
NTEVSSVGFTHSTVRNRLAQDSKTKLRDTQVWTSMCLAVPGLVESIEEDYAQVDFGGVSKKVCVSLLPDLEEGEYVIVHTGYAIEKIKPEEAKKTIKLWEEMAEMAAGMEPPGP